MKAEPLVNDEIPDRVVWVSLAEDDLQALLRVARAGEAYISYMQLKQNPGWDLSLIHI